MQVVNLYSHRWRLENWTLFFVLMCVFTLLSGWNPVQRLVGFCSEISLFVFQGPDSVSHSSAFSQSCFDLTREM